MTGLDKRIIHSTAMPYNTTWRHCDLSLETLTSTHIRMWKCSDFTLKPTIIFVTARSRKRSTLQVRVMDTRVNGTPAWGRPPREGRDGGLRGWTGGKYRHNSAAVWRATAWAATLTPATKRKTEAEREAAGDTHWSLVFIRAQGCRSTLVSPSKTQRGAFPVLILVLLEHND